MLNSVCKFRNPIRKFTGFWPYPYVSLIYSRVVISNANLTDITKIGTFVIIFCRQPRGLVHLQHGCYREFH